MGTEHGLRDVQEEDRCVQEAAQEVKGPTHGGQNGQINNIKINYFLNVHVASKSRGQPASRNLIVKYGASMSSCRDAQKCLQNLSGAKNGASRISWRVES